MCNTGNIKLRMTTGTKRNYDSDQGSRSIGDSSNFDSENESTRKSSIADSVLAGSDSDVQAIQLHRRILDKVRKDAYSNGRADEDLAGSVGADDELGKKLAANRLAASRCRKRKRLYTKGLEDMILQLVKEVYHYKQMVKDSKPHGDPVVAEQTKIKRVKQDPTMSPSMNQHVLQGHLNKVLTMTPPINSTLPSMNYQANQPMPMALNGPLYGTYTNNLISGMAFPQPNGLMPTPNLNCLPNAHANPIQSLTHTLFQQTTAGLGKTKNM